MKKSMTPSIVGLEKENEACSDWPGATRRATPHFLNSDADSSKISRSERYHNRFVVAGFCWGLLTCGQLFSGWGLLTQVHVKPYRVTPLTQCVISALLWDRNATWGCAGGLLTPPNLCSVCSVVGRDFRARRVCVQPGRRCIRIRRDTLTRRCRVFACG